MGGGGEGGGAEISHGKFPGPLLCTIVVLVDVRFVQPGRKAVIIFEFHFVMQFRHGVSFLGVFFVFFVTKFCDATPGAHFSIHKSLQYPYRLMPSCRPGFEPRTSV
jgi:hypothetical protein